MASNHLLCWICGNDVALEQCKTDEHGQPVHEHCYAVRVLLEDAASLPDPDLTRWQQHRFVTDVNNMFKKK